MFYETLFAFLFILVAGTTLGWLGFSWYEDRELALQAKHYAWLAEVREKKMVDALNGQPIAEVKRSDGVRDVYFLELKALPF